MKKIIYALLLTWLYSGACQSPDSSQQDASPLLVNPSVKARIDSTLKGFIDSADAVGVSALIFEKNQEVYFKAIGFADREVNVPMDRNAIVRIFSMTKPITGVALMKLYEQGAFELDDPLAKYAPEFSDMKVFAGVDASGKITLEPAKRPITIRDLTRHTAGFADDEHPQLGSMVQKANVMDFQGTLTQMAQKLAKLPLMFLKEETVKLMATNHLSDSVTERTFLPDKGQVGFGIDFAVRLRPPASKEENNGVVGEFFWDGLASTLFWVDPKNELTAVFFVQVMPFTGELHKKFRDAVYGPYDPAVALKGD